MKKINQENLLDTAPEWGGYTLNDLRYKRAVNHVKMEIAKERVLMSTNKVFSFKAQALNSGKLVGKLFTSFSIMDYALVAFQVGKQVRKIYRLFRR